MKHTPILTVAALLLLPGLALADGPHTITFDTDAQGVTITAGTIISDQYAAWGAHFVPNVFGGTGSDGNAYADNTTLDVTTPDDLISNSAYIGATPLQGDLLYSFSSYFSEDGDPNFWIQFDQPVQDISLDVYTSGLDASDDVIVYGFDSTFNLVGSSSAFASSTPDGFAHVVLPQSGLVSYLGFETGYGPYAGFDNITFTPAPEPTTPAVFAFAGLGVLGLALRARKRRT